MATLGAACVYFTLNPLWNWQLVQGARAEERKGDHFSLLSRATEFRRRRRQRTEEADRPELHRSNQARDRISDVVSLALASADRVFPDAADQTRLRAAGLIGLTDELVHREGVVKENTNIPH